MELKKEIIWLAGGDGLIGNFLTNSLFADEFHWLIFTRKIKKSHRPNVEYVLWNTETQTIPDDILRPDHIINLAGAGIADRLWTAARKQIIIASRVNSALTIKNYLEKHQITPSTYISASAIGYYGDLGEDLADEYSNKGNGFLAHCCGLWEAAAKETGSLCKRTIILRFGLVLSTKGGVLARMLMTKPIRLFQYFGNGRQWYSWIHIQDAGEIIYTLIRNTQCVGVYNLVSPDPINNREMMHDIMKTNKWKGILLSVPTFALKWMLGEMASVVLDSTKVKPTALLNFGYKFNFLRPGEAVKDLITKRL